VSESLPDLIMLKSIMRLGQPIIDTKMLVDMRLECLNCGEVIPRGKIVAFCSETCEHAFYERHLGGNEGLGKE
jgi:hypothetical protein